MFSLCLWLVTHVFPRAWDRYVESLKASSIEEGVSRGYQDGARICRETARELLHKQQLIAPTGRALAHVEERLVRRIKNPNVLQLEAVRMADEVHSLAVAQREAGTETI